MKSPPASPDEVSVELKQVIYNSGLILITTRRLHLDPIIILLTSANLRLKLIYKKIDGNIANSFITIITIG